VQDGNEEEDKKTVQNKWEQIERKIGWELLLNVKFKCRIEIDMKGFGYCCGKFGIIFGIRKVSWSFNNICNVNYFYINIFLI